MPAAVRPVRFEVKLPPGLAPRAREELLDRGGAAGDDALRFGYLLGIERAALPGLPAVARLIRLLRECVIEPAGLAAGRRYEAVAPRNGAG